MEIKSNKKIISLKKVFVKYLLSITVTFSVLLIVIVFMANLALKNEVLIPANYVEELIRKEKPILSSVTKISEDMIPKGCRYTVLDKKFHLISTNMNDFDLKESIAYAKGDLNDGVNNKYYYFIERQDGYCILQYNIKVSYGSKWMNEHFLNPQAFMIIMIILGCLILTFIITMMFVKNLKRHLIPISNATENIKEHDLDFNIGISEIKEFNDILISIDEMKRELKYSLEKQWNLEQMKQENISSLAHDIKTPLTIIKGNTELLQDSNLNEEQKNYAKFILKNTNHIEKYVKMLVQISKEDLDFSIKLEKIDANKFIENIYDEIQAIVMPKQIKIGFKKKNIPDIIEGDKSLLFRAIMNIISNAVDYSPNKSMIKFYIIGNEKNIKFIIEDEGKGFSKEALKLATNEFYMEDSSRTSKNHFGMGLYIADSIAKKHYGRLYIENSLDTKGAKVTIEIPLV